MILIACAIFFRGDQILLGRRAPHKAAYPNCWDVIGGHVDPGETIEQALIREAEEEVGLIPRQFRQVQAIWHGAYCHHLFAVSVWDGDEPKLLGDEHTEIGWFTRHAACALVPLALTEYPAIFQQLPLRLSF